MARRLLRMKADIASNGNGPGASLGPETGDPWPTVPWHCQQPYFMKLALPLVASAAKATLEDRARPAASAASPSLRLTIRIFFLPQRGCVTESISAGWPRLTTCTASLSAAPSSFGSLIGPLAHQ